MRGSLHLPLRAVFSSLTLLSAAILHPRSRQRLKPAARHELLSRGEGVPELPELPPVLQ